MVFLLVLFIRKMVGGNVEVGVEVRVQRRKVSYVVVIIGEKEVSEDLNQRYRDIGKVVGCAVSKFFGLVDGGCVVERKLQLIDVKGE